MLFDIKNSEDLLYPKQISIETFHGCNARCVFCSIEKWKRPQGMMSDNIFEIIMEQLSDWGPKHLKQTGLALCGEPLLDPRLTHRLKRCKAEKLPNIGITTHGSLMTPEKTDSILEADPDYVVFSFDTLNKKAYEEHRRRLNHDTVLENILNFIKKRNQIKSNVRIVIRHIDYKGDKSEFEMYRHYFQDLLQEDLDEIGYTKLHNASILPSAKWPGNSMSEGDYGSTRCGAPFNRLTIQSSGDVVMCPNDFNAIYNLGNVAQDHMLNLFNCDSYREIRKIHDEGRRNILKKCNTCDEPELNEDGDMYAKFTPSGKKFFANVFEGFDYSTERKKLKNMK